MIFHNTPWRSGDPRVCRSMLGSVIMIQNLDISTPAYTCRLFLASRPREKSSQNLILKLLGMLAIPQFKARFQSSKQFQAPTLRLSESDVKLYKITLFKGAAWCCVWLVRLLLEV